MATRLLLRMVRSRSGLMDSQSESCLDIDCFQNFSTLCPFRRELSVLQRAVRLSPAGAGTIAHVVSKADAPTQSNNMKCNPLFGGLLITMTPLGERAAKLLPTVWKLRGQLFDRLRWRLCCGSSLACHHIVPLLLLLCACRIGKYYCLSRADERKSLSHSAGLSRRWCVRSDNAGLHSSSCWSIISYCDELVCASLQEKPSFYSYLLYGKQQSAFHQNSCTSQVCVLF